MKPMMCFIVKRASYHGLLTGSPEACLLEPFRHSLRMSEAKQIFNARFWPLNEFACTSNLPIWAVLVIWNLYGSNSYGVPEFPNAFMGETL